MTPACPRCGDDGRAVFVIDAGTCKRWRHGGCPIAGGDVTWDVDDDTAATCKAEYDAAMAAYRAQYEGGKP